jgi:hypothetical protein
MLIHYSLWISDFFGPLQNYLKKTADCKINRYRVVRLIGFAWNKVASVGDDVSAFE